MQSYIYLVTSPGCQQLQTGEITMGPPETGGVTFVFTALKDCSF